MIRRLAAAGVVSLALPLAILAAAPANAASNWSSDGKAGAQAWGTVSYKGGRIYIKGTLKDVKADKHSARLRIRFQDSPGIPRYEQVSVGGYGKSRSFAYNSGKDYVAVQECVYNGWGETCGRWKWL
ncbi:hypothetical protein [Bailinhaonella thermotolerans]|uniref:Secreted protein n=1 Tax=Bailinhaonella thermotolerans TaxID=1070861 RepID=A0A3A4APN2_9ACTN|nr:hypothetical protein [Bailinhaonella thermotolerans]RJL23238.1 hypothetical protein D5H75_33245 [Bailinhaonella thermotolerans]